VLLDFAAIEEVSILNHPAQYRTELMRRSHVVVNQGNYAAHGRAFRDYRSYQLGAEYAGQQWTTIGGRIWSNDSVETWAITTIVGSRHSRQS
jgi:hypothetical protein